MFKRIFLGSLGGGYMVILISRMWLVISVVYEKEVCVLIVGGSVVGYVEFVVYWIIVVFCVL